MGMDMQRMTIEQSISAVCEQHNIFVSTVHVLDRDLCMWIVGALSDDEYKPMLIINAICQFLTWNALDNLMRWSELNRGVEI